MKAIATYLCTDGMIHVFDAADRMNPLCGADVFYTREARDAGAALVCDDCCELVLDEVATL
jgi:hypothetical protein